MPACLYDARGLCGGHLADPRKRVHVQRLASYDQDVPTETSRYLNATVAFGTAGAISLELPAASTISACGTSVT